MSETSLQEMLQRVALLPKPTRLLILQQVAEELDTAHRREKLHGHLTPKSIVVTEGTPRGLIAAVTDFGAKFVLDNEILGDRLPEDVHYISPEQILGLDLGEQSDLFSFAVIAYELVCGKKPFEADGISPLFYKICTEPAEAIEKVDPSLSGEVNRVFERALAKKPERRYGNGRDFIQALATALGHCEGWNENSRVPEPPPAFAAAAAVNPAPRTRQAPEPRAPTRAAYELPTLQRRRRYRDEADDDEDGLGAGASRTKKLILAAAVCIFLGGAGVFFTRWVRTPNLPVQVLDTKGGPSTPPPQSTSPAQTPSTSPSTLPEQSPSASTPAPAPQEKPPEAAADTTPPPTAAPAPQPTTSPTDVPSGTTQSKPERPANEANRAAGKPERSPSDSAPSRDTSPGGTASVEFLTIPPGGRMVVDNNPLMTCTAPCSMPLNNGRHTLRAQLQGYTVAQRVFNVPDENTQTIALAKQTGALVVTSVPAAATILVDGTDFGLTPATLHLTPGQHRLTLLNGSQRHEEVVTVVGDAIQAANVTFPQ